MSESATGSYADVALDNELEGSDRTASNLILVGGPSVNSLVGELVDENQTMPASDYTEGEGMVQMVDGFGDHSALIVAGHSGEDTRAAGEFLADYRNNQEAMAGQSQVTVSTETGQVVE
jgi:S-layer protein (TIGR01564 family)